MKIAARQGIKLPEEFEGYRIADYPEIWLADKRLAKTLLLRFVMSIGERIKTYQAFVGDLLVLQQPGTGEISIGVHSGNGYALVAFEDAGVRLAPISDFMVRRAYRMKKKNE